MNVEDIIKGKYKKASSFKDTLYRIRAHITAFAITMIMIYIAMFVIGGGLSWLILFSLSIILVPSFSDFLYNTDSTELHAQTFLVGIMTTIVYLILTISNPTVTKANENVLSDIMFTYDSSNNIIMGYTDQYGISGTHRLVGGIESVKAIKEGCRPAIEIMKISYPNNSAYLPDMGTRMKCDTDEITMKGDFK